VPRVTDRSELPVRLVVLNYNGGAFIERCLRHILDLDWPSDRLQVVCLDNGSTDGSADMIERDFPTVELRRLATNDGFPANNQAMTDLDGVRFVGLINNDAFVERGWLRPLVDALDADRGLGAVSSKLVLAPRFASVAITVDPLDHGPTDARELGVRVRGASAGGEDVSRDVHLGDTGWGREVDRTGSFEWSKPTAVIRIPAPTESGSFDVVIDIDAPVRATLTIDGGDGPRDVQIGAGRTGVPVTVSTERFDVINNVGSIVYEDGAGADRGWLEIDEGQFDRPADVFAWCGGSVLFRPEYLTDAGLFDEHFFLYYEDTDLSWRGRSLGWRYRTVPGSVARHLHAASTDEGSAIFAHYVERNRLLMLTKNAPRSLVRRQVWRYLLTTASYARQDIVRPVLRLKRPWPGTVKRRLWSFAGYVRMLPTMIGERRVIRSRRIVPDRELLGWFVSRT
jgi:GT2 family glycosyltransferase